MVSLSMVDEKSVREGYKKLTLSLIEKRLTISTMESCTGGQIASLITDTDGASNVLRGAFVTYCDEAKVLNGVSKKIIEEAGVYSKETAEQMAFSCKKFYKADIGIGITGIMSTKKQGTVYFAVCSDKKNISLKVEIPSFDNRLSYKLFTAQKILDAVNEVLSVYG